MEARDRDLGGAGEVEAVGRDRVDAVFVSGEMAGSEQRLELLRRRLALDLRARTKLVDARHELAPLLVCREPGVECLGRALAREPATELVRLLAGGVGVDHRTESK